VHPDNGIRPHFGRLAQRKPSNEVIDDNDFPDASFRDNTWLPGCLGLDRGEWTTLEHGWDYHHIDGAEQNARHVMARTRENHSIGNSGISHHLLDGRAIWAVANKQAPTIMPLPDDFTNNLQ
jgi:hypothetical protein